ncbi:transglycosylase SLT domain-containing protein [Alteromonas sp. MB-3u-76]|uniref:transglycosylase SLT domain-containing protein n=1 Tax=Alteromonas sp. MB-3u-76 TaxID=2058133 RepID=UPI001E449F3D|nr:transglycosylase SLT domain-containing protein [Alteromonas sp. MB-3u-76]
MSKAIHLSKHAPALLVYLLLSVVVIPHTVAQPLPGHTLTLPQDVYAQQRQHFLNLEEKLRTYSRRRVNDFDGEIYALADYPLYPYLLRLKLERTMSIATKREVNQFLEDYRGQPVSYGLRYKWLSYLAKHNHRNAFLDSYRSGMGARLTCVALNYRLQGAEPVAKVLREVDALWLSGQSQPDECDPLFSKWKKAGLMTSTMVIKRIEIAAKEKNRRIIHYLKRQLPAKYQYIADIWLAVTRNVSNVQKRGLFPLKNKPSEVEAMVWALEKLAWQKPALAEKVYQRYQRQGVFSDAQRHAINRAIALSFTLEKLPQAHEWLEYADIPGASDDIKLWHVSHLLRTQQFDEVIRIIEQAPVSLKNKANYRYWLARALEQTGQPMQATVLYRQLAQERHYYGFMASARINAFPSLKNNPAPKDVATIAKLATTPATLRAVEFFRLNRATEARREWYYLLTHIPNEQVTDAGILAYEWGLYDQAISSFARSGYWDDVGRRFPLAFNEVFSEKAQLHNIPTSFAMAIARRESSFRSDAISPVGAAGLMQLMPGTAKYVAQAKVSQSQLFNVNENVEFGVQYLRYLMDKLNNNPVLVSASYNAGWRKVLEWLPENEALPVDIWIENIPYKETRAYVKAVMAYQHIYEQQLGGNNNIFPQLTSDLIPSAEAVSTHPVTGIVQLAPK